MAAIFARPLAEQFAAEEGVSSIATAGSLKTPRSFMPSYWGGTPRVVALRIDPMTRRNLPMNCRKPSLTLLPSTWGFRL